MSLRCDSLQVNNAQTDTKFSGTALALCKAMNAFAEVRQAVVIEAPVLKPGMLIERYELLTRIAEGGMAVVWLARVTGSFGFEKLVAVKTIRAKFARDSQYQKMFLDESRIASLVRHPNIVEVLDVGVFQGVPYQVLEWIDGDGLAALHRVARRRNQAIPTKVGLKIVAQVCAGLHAAHQLQKDGQRLRVVHRDVNPQNVLVSQEGQVKLIDFGIAKAAERLSEDTRTGLIKGKISYLAPEQAACMPIDHRVDIWACGVVLYQLLFGDPPSPHENPQRYNPLLDPIDAYPRLKELEPELQRILSLSLAADPRCRYASAREMELDLERLAQSQGPLTSGDLSRALEPLREQRAARLVVIEGALHNSRSRQKKRETSNGESSYRVSPLPDEPLTPRAGRADAMTQVSLETLCSQENEQWKEQLKIAFQSLRTVSKTTLHLARTGMLGHMIHIRRQLDAPPRYLKGLLLCVATGAMLWTAYTSGYRSGSMHTQLLVKSGQTQAFCPSAGSLARSK